MSAWLQGTDACGDGAEWAGDKTLLKAWRTCPRVRGVGLAAYSLEKHRHEATGFPWVANRGEDHASPVFYGPGRRRLLPTTGVLEKA